MQLRTVRAQTARRARGRSGRCVLGRRRKGAVGSFPGLVLLARRRGKGPRQCRDPKREASAERTRQRPSLALTSPADVIETASVLNALSAAAHELSCCWSGAFKGAARSGIVRN